MACLHDHSCEDHDCSSDWSLYKHIDLPRVSANLSLSLSLSLAHEFSSLAMLITTSNHSKLVRIIIFLRAI